MGSKERIPKAMFGFTYYNYVINLFIQIFMSNKVLFSMFIYVKKNDI